MPHFHIPLQSGNDEILALMHRRYKRDVFAHKIAEIKRRMPNAFIGVDVIVGFNGETEEHFNDSFEFLQSLDVTRLHVFPYSPRPNTAALSFKPYVQNEEKKRRTDILMDFSEKRLHEFMKSQIGTPAKVLWEDTDTNVMHGFTENYIRVSAPYDASKINTITDVVLGDFDDDNECLKAK